MTYKENIRAILECYFTGFKDEIIDSACNRILEQEPILDKIRAEIFEEMQYHSGTGEEVIQAYADGLHNAIRIIDKYKGESEDKE